MKRKVCVTFGGAITALVCVCAAIICCVCVDYILGRIYRLYLSGYGTAKLVEKAERFLNVPQVGMMF